jgi:hypothetical protein
VNRRTFLAGLLALHVVKPLVALLQRLSPPPSIDDLLEKAWANVVANAGAPDVLLMHPNVWMELQIATHTADPVERCRYRIAQRARNPVRSGYAAWAERAL